MEKNILIKKLNKILENEEMDAEHYVKSKDLEMGVFWFKDDCLMFGQEPVAWISSIQDVRYYGKEYVEEEENTGVHIVFYVYGYTAHIILNEDELDDTLWINKKDSRYSLEEKEGREFIQKKLKEQKVRNWILNGFEFAWFGYEDPEEYKQIFVKEAEEYIADHPDDEEIKYAYMDLYFFNDESGCSEEHIYDWAAGDIGTYIEHFESQVWNYCEGILDEEEIKKTVAKAYIYLKAKNQKTE